MKKFSNFGIVFIVCALFMIPALANSAEKLSDKVGITMSGLCYVANDLVVEAGYGCPNYYKMSTKELMPMTLDKSTGFWTFQTDQRPKVGQFVTIDIELEYTDKWLAHVGVDMNWWKGYPPGAKNPGDYLAVDNTVEGFKFRGPALAKAPWE